MLNNHQHRPGSGHHVNDLGEPGGSCCDGLADSLSQSEDVIQACDLDQHGMLPARQQGAVLVS